MDPYYSKSGKASGVIATESGFDYIRVYYLDSDGETFICYPYSYESAGERAVEIMKDKAKANKGLSTYISQNKPGYTSFSERCYR